MQEKRRRKKGLAAIFAMAVFVFITILAMGILRISDSNTLGIQSEIRRSQAEYIARSGLEIGMSAVQVKHPTEKVSIVEKVLEKPTDPSLYLKNGYDNLSSSGSRGDVIEIKDSAGNKIGDVQIIIYSLTGKDGESDQISFDYLTPSSPAVTQQIDRKKLRDNLRVNKAQQATWVFHIVAIGQTSDYENVGSRYPMARQIMTAEMSMQNPSVVKIYSGY
ncbi:MAG: hypothetical protein Q4A78_06010 [Peptostreptococcaceae bacterium]|nr:hypothetical protein [Peptostreptococcaceae bacterium]